MGSLSRPSSGGAPRTRLLVVRGQSRSVRPEDTGPPKATRTNLIIALITGSLAALWLIGLLGYRLGFAAAIRVPDLLLPPADAFAGGIIMLISVPACILAAGLAQPLALMAVLLSCAIPAGALVAARPLQPGGPRLKPLASGIAVSGAMLAILAALGAIAWTGSVTRSEALVALPAEAARLPEWREGIAAIAGFDVAVLATIVLFTILLTRLPIARWLRVLALCGTGFALASTLTATSISLGTAAHLSAARPVAAFPPDQQAMVLGRTPGHMVLLQRSGNEHDAHAIVHLYADTNPSMLRLRIVERRRIEDFAAR